MGPSWTRLKKNKFNATRTKYTSPLWGERTYDSKAEARYAERLDLLIRSGVSTVYWWLPQPQILLAGSVRYRPDFLVCSAPRCNGTFRPTFEVELVDVKGKEMERFKVIRDLWPGYGSLPLRIVKEQHVDEVLYPDALNRVCPPLSGQRD